MNKLFYFPILKPVILDTVRFETLVMSMRNLDKKLKGLSLTYTHLTKVSKMKRRVKEWIGNTNEKMHTNSEDCEKIKKRCEKIHEN